MLKNNLLLICNLVKIIVHIDSPGCPPSATAHELFRGFSFIAPSLDENCAKNVENNQKNQV